MSAIPRFPAQSSKALCSVASLTIAFGLFAPVGAHAETDPAGPGFFHSAPQSLLSTDLFAAPVSTSAGNLTSSSLSASLPEAPAPQFATEPKPKHGTDRSQKIARKSTKVIPSDWKAQPLSWKNKAHVGLDGIFSVENLAGTLIAAGYEHLVDGEPNYGTDRGAFGERLGAAALRGASQTAFTDMVFAPLLHEDPRYYVMGPGKKPIRRLMYAITRPFVTRRDMGSESETGSTTINGSLLLGYAAAAALTPAYYPQMNHNFGDVASVYGGSIGGAALGFAISEFSEDVLRSVHLAHRP